MSEPPKKESFLWILWGLQGASMMSIGAFINGKKFVKYGFISCAYQGPGLLLVFCLIRLGLEINSRRSNINLCKQIWYDEKGYFKRRNFIGILLIAILNFIWLVNVNLAFMFAFKGGLNQGMPAVFATASALYNFVAFYFIFNEKIEWYQVIGMVSLLAGVAFLCLESAAQSESTAASSVFSFFVSSYVAWWVSYFVVGSGPSGRSLWGVDHQ